MKRSTVILLAYICLTLGLSFTAVLLSGCGRTADYGICIISSNGKVEANGGEFFAMHSIVKFPQALYVAGCMSRNRIALDSSVTVHKTELMQDTWSPMLEAMGDTEEFSIRELLRLSLVESDNNACDLLFELFGMPDSVDAFLKGLGFHDINVAATERQMHDDPVRAAGNCCTPAEMARLLLWFNEHKDDNAHYREIWGMMSACNTGAERIPAVFGEDCRIVHKTGTGFSPEDGLPQMNDAGIVTFPDGHILAVAVFVPHPNSQDDLSEIISQKLKDLE